MLAENPETGCGNDVKGAGQDVFQVFFRSVLFER
jgi:hypothetical protein